MATTVAGMCDLVRDFYSRNIVGDQEGVYKPLHEWLEVGLPVTTTALSVATLVISFFAAVLPSVTWIGSVILPITAIGTAVAAIAGAATSLYLSTFRKTIVGEPDGLAAKNLALEARVKALESRIMELEADDTGSQESQGSHDYEHVQSPTTTK